MSQSLCPLPPLAEQHEIVRRVEQLFALADRLEAPLDAARKRVDRLRQSILAKAFRGELVPTEADLARREGRTYEPASQLLARIRSLVRWRESAIDDWMESDCQSATASEGGQR